MEVPHSALTGATGEELYACMDAGTYASPFFSSMLAKRIIGTSSGRQEVDNRFSVGPEGHNHDGVNSRSISTLATWEQKGGAGGADTNTYLSNQVIYRGWTAVQGNGTNSANIGVTFPNNGFDDAEWDIGLTVVGAKTSGGAPSARTDFNTNYSASTGKIITRSATGFTIEMDLWTLTIPVGSYILFSWIAIGTKKPV